MKTRSKRKPKKTQQLVLKRNNKTNEDYTIENYYTIFEKNKNRK